MSWESYGIALLAAALVRPFGLAAAAWLILRIFRVRHPASRHTVWTAVLIGMLLLPVMNVIAPHWKLPLLPRRHDSVARGLALRPPSPPSQSLDSATEPTTDAAESSIGATSAGFELPVVETMLLWFYAAGLLVMVAYRAAGWALLWRVVARSTPFRKQRLRESSDVATPVAVGVVRPVVILPAGWRTWSANTKRAVLAHEFAHLRRHDALVAALARFVKCVFWFHPLAWWVSQKITDLAELACDAAVLERIDDPAGYSRILLEFADKVNRAGHRVALPGLAMAAGSGMSRRIDQVFELSGGLSAGTLRRLARPGLWLTLMGVPVICLAATVGLSEGGAPAPRPVSPATPIAALVQSPQAIPKAPPAPVPTVASVPERADAPQPAPVAAAPEAPVQVTAPPQSAIQAAPQPTPKFEVASIKPCKDPMPPGGRGGGPRGNPSPGRLDMNCQTVAGFIQAAYLIYANGQTNPPWAVLGVPIEGGPGWIRSDRYSIDAKAEGDASNEMMHGPMLQALLEERFNLKIHRETRQIPVYELTVAKGGPKLKPFEEGSCTPIDFTKFPLPPPVSGQKYCKAMGIRKNGILVVDAEATSLNEFCQLFLRRLDRPVIDKTGIAGKFDVHLEFAPDETTPVGLRGGGEPSGDPGAAPMDTAAAPPIAAALQQQLGLKLVPAKGPGDFLVIDRVEKPSEN